MRISDWSSDVCSSDLRVGRRPEGGFGDRPIRLERVECRAGHYMAFKDGKGSAVRDDPHIIDIAEAIGGAQPLRNRLAQDETQFLRAIDGDDQVGRRTGREKVCTYW